MMQMNINTEIKVKLTKRGIDILGEHHERLRQVNPNIGEFKPPIVDKDGYITIHLCDFMYIFGNEMHFGNQNLPIDTIIEIPKDSLMEKPMRRIR